MTKLEGLVWKGKEYRVTSEVSKFQPGFRPVILTASGQTAFIGQKVFPTIQEAEEYALQVFEGRIQGFRF